MKNTVSAVIAFLLLGLFAGFAAAAPDVVGETVKYSGGGATMEGYFAYDRNIKAKRPGVLVVHEWWGLNDYARSRARMLAEIGYAALAVDMYGDDKVAAHPADAQKFSSELMKNFPVARARFLAALEFLKQQPSVDPSRIAAIGYCFGGGIVLNMARQGVDLKGVASFHGNLTPIEPAKPGTVKARILVMNGEADTLVPLPQREQFKQEMRAARVDFRFIDYPGALHSFTNPDSDEIARKFNMPIGYNRDADQKSWQELEKFLKDVFAK